jgi:hypothetical protein
VTTIQCSCFLPVLAKAKVVSRRSPAASNSVQVLVLEGSLDVKAVIPKAYHGNTFHDRLKTKNIVTSPLLPTIAGSNITKILSITDSESYDVAEDASQWHNSIKKIHRHAVHYDVMAIYLVPIKFSTSDVNSVTTSPGFVNAILDWKNFQDEDCFFWEDQRRLKKVSNSEFHYKNSLGRPLATF